MIQSKRSKTEANIGKRCQFWLHLEQVSVGVPFCRCQTQRSQFQSRWNQFHAPRNQHGSTTTILQCKPDKLAKLAVHACHRKRNMAGAREGKETSARIYIRMPFLSLVCSQPHMISWKSTCPITSNPSKSCFWIHLFHVKAETETPSYRLHSSASLTLHI